MSDKQQQMIIREHGQYNIEKILKFAEDLPEHLIHTSHFFDFLKSEVFWSSTLEKMVSPYDVITGKIKDDNNHIFNIRTIDPDTPIIISDIMAPNNAPVYTKSIKKDVQKGDKKIMFGLVEIKGNYDIIYGLYKLIHQIYIKKSEYVLVKYLSWDSLYESRVSCIYTRNPEDGRYYIKIDDLIGF